MPLALFLGRTVLISLSGVMAPGPVTGVTVAHGQSSPHAGALVSLGHGIVEVPLMVLILAGFGVFLKKPGVQITVGLLGGLFLLIMAAAMFRSLRSQAPEGDGSHRSALVSGVALTIGNPYFLVWWATVGAALAGQAAAFGVLGFVLFGLVHWLCDLGWYWFLSAAAHRGGRQFGPKFQHTVAVFCGGVLAVFGVWFVADAVRMMR